MFLAGEDISEAIRSQEVTQQVTPVSADALVREVLVEQQRRDRIQRALGGGRPRHRHRGVHEACCKIFLTASPEARARRRFLELQAKGQSPACEDVLHDLQRRDQADRTRAVAPLRKAEDAVELDSSDLSLDQVVDRIVAEHQAHP